VGKIKIVFIGYCQRLFLFENEEFVYDVAETYVEKANWPLSLATDFA